MVEDYMFHYLAYRELKLMKLVDNLQECFSFPFGIPRRVILADSHSCRTVNCCKD